MPSDLQVSNIRDLNNANSAISIASDGQVTISQNNPTVTLGSNTTFGSGVSLANATFPGPPTGASGGHVLQVVSTTYSTYTSNATGTWEDTNLTASITPSDQSNKVLILVSQAFGISSSDSSEHQQQVNLAITDSSNNILFGQSGYDQFRVKNTMVFLWQTNLMYLHHPNTESSFTYKTRFRKQAGSSSTIVTAQYGSNPSSMTLMEVVG